MSVDIAIVGMASKVPGAADIQQFWRLLAAGEDAITHYTVEQLVAAGVPRSVIDHPDFVPAEPTMPGFDEFDAPLFGFSPREARLTDPQLRIFLETCHAAVENAGYDPFAVPGRVSVIGSAGAQNYLFDHLSSVWEPATQGQLAMGNLLDYLSTQAAYRFNYTGPALTMLTACSSSLVGAYLATMALRADDCDVALVGGSALELDARYGYFYAGGGVRSPDGVCRPFDVSGAGTVFGGGAGIVVLKRLDDALADGDHVYGVIRGIGVTNDGSDKTGFPAPSVSGQVGAIRAALRSAGVTPADIAYVEAHATGTAVGDPIEVTALTQAWRSAAAAELAPRGCGIGSVKSNIGHLAQAAGVTGLLKLTLALEHGTMPASLHVDQPIKELQADDTPFRVVTEAELWERGGRPRVGAVSSFGAGGTNVHVILEEGPAAAPTPPAGRERVVVWSSLSEAAAEQLAPVLADHLATTGAYEDSVTTLQRGRTPYRVRRAVVLSGPESAAAALSGADRAARSPPTRSPAAGASWFRFPGQGSLTPGTAVDLARTEPLFDERVRAAFGLYGERGPELERLWRDGTTLADLTRTGTAQPVLFALEWALAETLATGVSGPTR